MITVYKLAGVCLLLISSNLVHAATKSKSINLNLSYNPYVKFVGTAAGSSNTYSNNDIAFWIFPSVVDLGTLGLESNINETCDISFSTSNNYRLRHTVSGQNLTNYKLTYRTLDFSQTSNPALSVPCNTTLPTTLKFTPTQFVWANWNPAITMEQGIYKDIVTVIVTTQ